MGFFNDLGKKTSETTNRIAREAKLKVKMSENKGKILDLYKEIGKKVYEKHIREEDINIKEDLLEDCQSIDKLATEVKDAEKEILKLNQKRLCNKCNEEIEISAQYCPKCGEKQEIEKEQEAKEVEIVEQAKEENKKD